jgi:hypothetical protein
MKKLYGFTQLSNLAQIKAVYDYLKGWEETHKENDMDFNEVFDILLDSRDDLYTVNGKLFEEEY